MPFDVRVLGSNDADLMDAFLKPHSAKAFFLRSNALQAGLVYEGMPLQATYIGAFRGAALVGVAAYTWLKTILLFVEDLDALPDMLPLLRATIVSHGGRLDAVLGIKAQADRLTDLLRLQPSDYRQDAQDWLFRLDVAAMNHPVAPQNKGVSLRRAEENDAQQLIDWRIAFNIEACAAIPSEKMAQEVREEILRKINGKELFVLEKDGQLVSMCSVFGTQASIDDTVILGMVWTPPALRGQGFAKMVVGGAIATVAHEWGTLKQAILFASRADAISVYKALGFVEIADWRLAFLHDGFKIGAL